MIIQPPPALTFLQLISPIFVAVLWIAALSLLKEPGRRNLSALLIAGAGAAYLNGGLGVWEFAFCALLTSLAYWGLHDYRFIGAAWMLHTGWDIVHYLYGNPIVPFVPTSSAGCAVCDLVLSTWYLSSAPSIYGLLRMPKAIGSGNRY